VIYCIHQDVLELTVVGCGDEDRELDGEDTLLDAVDQAFFPLLDQTDVIADVMFALTGDAGDLLEIPAFVVKAFQFAGEVHAAGLGAGDVLDQRLQVCLFAGAGHDLGLDRFAAQSLVGQQVEVPLFEQQVPLLEDPDADPEKGTGAVMC